MVGERVKVWEDFICVLLAWLPTMIIRYYLYLKHARRNEQSCQVKNNVGRLKIWREAFFVQIFGLSETTYENRRNRFPPNHNHNSKKKKLLSLSASEFQVRINQHTHSKASASRER